MSYDGGCFKCGNDPPWNTCDRGLACPKFELRPELARFANQMEIKLRKRDHLKRKAPLDISSLLVRLTEEARELVDAIRSRDSKSVAEEAIDVANFAMLIHKRVFIGGE